MKRLKVSVLSVILGMALMAGFNLAIGPVDQVSAREEPRGDHWRNHDGHWSFWCAADSRWYYTDGIHWFFHDGKTWLPYRFDKHFGKEGFVHGEYKIPAEKARIVLPVHEIHRR